MPSPDPAHLEDLIHRQLRALPDCAAPPTLEARVLGAIARRAALPWWRRPHTQWPAALRGAFILLLAVGAAGVLALSRSPFAARAVSGLALRFPWLEFLQALAANLLDTARALFDALPKAWLYGAVALLVVCYGLLFGLGAALYRAFYGPRRVFRPLSP